MYNCKEKQNTNNNSGVPIGTIINFFGDTAPEGYLSCDGTEYVKSDYPQLADLLLNLTDHTPYEGSDANHFKVPDLRGEFLRGTGTNGHTNQGSGANVGTHQDATIFPSMYTNNDGNFQILAGGGNVNAYGTLGNGDSSYNSGNEWVAFNYANKYAASKDVIRTSRPTNTSVLYCIKY